MTFCLRLKNPKKEKFIRIKFNLENLKNPDIETLFIHRIDEKLSAKHLTNIFNNEEILQKMNKTLIDTASEILGKHREKKKTGSLKNKWICVT